MPSPSIDVAASVRVAAERRPVLVACDGTPASPDSLFNAAMLASRAFGGDIELIGVALPAPTGIVGMELAPIPMDYDEESQAALRENIARSVLVSAHGDRHWPVRVQSGSPSRVLADEAAARHASVLVMGIGRHNPLDRLFGTEITLSTMRESVTPVLAVGTHFPPEVRRAVVGMDFTPASIQAAHLALRLIGEDGHLTLIHVRPQFEHPAADWQAWDADYSKTLPPLLRQVLEQLHAPNTVTIDTVTVRGDPATALMAYAQQVSADLIAVGTQRHTLVERLMVGSVATRILRTAQCAVLTVPNGAVSQAMPQLEHANV